MLQAADFIGRWQIDRRIDDRHAGQTGTLAGTATFAPGGDGGLIYDERGTLRLGTGTPLEATRRYLWRFGAGGVEVRFADGAPFHAFVPAGRAAGTAHLCGADLYEVAYDFSGFPEWQAVWTVRGPRKDYTATTRHRRVSATLAPDGAMGQE